MDDKEYIILHEDGIIALENRINQYFQKGYLPDGELVVSHNGNKQGTSPIFMQRMKKKPVNES